MLALLNSVALLALTSAVAPSAIDDRLAVVRVAAQKNHLRW
jgi:hypothetical protein